MISKSHPNMILVDNVEEAKLILDGLKSLWEQKRPLSNKPEIIDRLIKSAEKKLKKKIRSFEGFIILSRDLSIIKALINSSNNLTYEIISSVSSPGDQLAIFLEYSKEMNDSQYWEELRNTYLIQDYTQIDYGLLSELFSAKRSSKEKLMTDDELEFLKSLPDKITVFRGCTIEEKKQKKYGLSWTLSKQIAEMFANKKTALNLQGVVIEKEITKNQIIAYFNERDEDEIILIT